MTIVRLDNISYRYASQDEYLFEEATALISSKSKIGLIGQNGSGKSTLFKIIQGELLPSSGVLFKKAGVKLAYLPQEISGNLDCSIEEYMWQADNNLFKLYQKICAAKLGHVFEDYSFFNTFSECGGEQFRAKVDRTLVKFDLEKKRTCKVSNLSGGEKTRLQLARLLLFNPSLILLDEPTNHLDLETRRWLESFLLDLTTPYIVISHDREFLDRCTEVTWKIEAKALCVQKGSYSLAKKIADDKHRSDEEKFRQQVKKVAALKRVIEDKKIKANSMESFKYSRSVKNNGGICKRDDGSGRSVDPSKTSRSAKAATSRLTRIVEKDSVPKPTVDIARKIQFPVNNPIKNNFIFTAQKISKKFQSEVFRELDFSIKNRDRLLISGKNGSGKSTLLRLLVGQDNVTSGELTFAPKVQVSYFCQEHTNLDYQKNVFENVCDGRFELKTLVRTVLNCLGIGKQLVESSISTLSHGEKSKVSLAKAVLAGGNVLILDEPTNHLDIRAKEILEEALLSYQGTLIMVSHDRSFASRVTSSHLQL